MPFENFYRVWLSALISSLKDPDRGCLFIRLQRSSYLSCALSCKPAYLTRFPLHYVSRFAKNLKTHISDAAELNSVHKIFALNWDEYCANRFSHLAALPYGAATIYRGGKVC